MTELVGILNLTPDSFSDGGKFLAPAAALAHVDALLADGAEIIDVGAESTRPGAKLLKAGQEWERLEPVLKGVIARAHAAHAGVSLDTRHPENAARGLALGVSWVNDESGLSDPAMLELLAQQDCRVVLMHSLGLPADPAITLPPESDPVKAVKEFFTTEIGRLGEAGIARERLILDPGIGFGKLPEHSLTLLLRIKELQIFHLPLLVGHSRKSFLKLFSDAPATGRDGPTLTLSAMLAANGVEYLRVHDVAAHRALLSGGGVGMPQ